MKFLEKNISYNDACKILLVFILGINIISYFFGIKLISYIGSGIGILGLIVPPFGIFFSKLWISLGEFLGKINSTIIFTAVFFLVLFPFSLMQKLFSSSDHLNLKRPNKSSFIKKDKIFSKEDLEKMW